MRRRALLSTLASASLAGCNALGLGDGDGRTTRPPLHVDTPTRTPTASPFDDPDTEPTPATGTRVGPTRTLVVRRANDAPDGFAVDAGFLSPATESTPALLWVGLRNATSSEATLDLGATPPVSTYRLRGGQLPLYLVPVTESDPTEGLRFWNACWKTRFRSVVETEDATRTVTVPPGETVGGRYGVAVMRGADVCLPTGQYAVDGDAGFSLGLSVFASRERPSSSQFEGATPPALADGTTRWYHAADAGTRRYLEPANEQVGLSNGRIRLALHNYGPGSLVRREHWRLLRRHAGVWHRVAPFAAVDRQADVSTVVRPGETDVTTLRVDSRPRLDHGDPATVGGLTPGRYAVAVPEVDVWRGTERSSTDTFAALVELVGDRPDLAPSSMVQETRRHGDTIDVYAEGDGDAPPETLVVDRLADTPDRSLLLAQVLQFQVLRDTLAYLVDGDVPRARLRTPAPRVERFVVGSAALDLPSNDADGVEFAFDGEGYRFRTVSR